MMQIDVQDLVFSYGGADVLQGVSFCADKGERIAVLGPNGVGIGFLLVQRHVVGNPFFGSIFFSTIAVFVIPVADAGHTSDNSLSHHTFLC